jgi:hypothetical protein
MSPSQRRCVECGRGFLPPFPGASLCRPCYRWSRLTPGEAEALQATVARLEAREKPLPRERLVPHRRQLSPAELRARDVALSIRSWEGAPD